MNLRVRPDGDDRFLTIEHEDWHCQWRMQFPEAIAANEGAIMAWPSNCRPEWQRLGDGWGYSWRTTDAYGTEVRAMNHRDTAGNPQYDKFFVGLALRAEVRTGNDELQLSLALANESRHTVHAVSCDGGCWQARCEAFAAADEVARSHVMVGGRMVSLAALPRTVAIRCMYRHDPSTYDGKGEWFWGRSTTAIDSPAILGSVSADGSKAIVLGYTEAVSGLANTDAHHCLHSSPSFGDIAPGQAVKRIGYVLFGSDIHALGTTLRTKLTAATSELASNRVVPTDP